MKNTKFTGDALIYLIITGLLFYVSAMWTGHYFFGEVDTKVKGSIAIAATLGIEIFKIKAWSAYNSNIDSKKIGKRSLILTWIALTIISLTFSMAYNINSINNNDNKLITKSDEYKRQNSIYNIALEKAEKDNNSLNALKDIDKIKENDSKLIKIKRDILKLGTVEAYISNDSIYSNFISDAKNAESINYITTKNIGSLVYYEKAKNRKLVLEKEFSSKLNSLESEKIKRENEITNSYNSKKNEIESNIDTNTNNLLMISKGFKDVEQKVKDTSGINGIIKMFSFGSNTAFSIISFIFVLILGLLIDFSACKSYQLYKHSKESNNKIELKNKDIDINKILKTAEEIQDTIQKQHNENPSYALDSLDKFTRKVYKLMQDTKYKSGQIKGIATLTKELKKKDENITENEIRASHNLLKKAGKLITRDKKTYLA